MTPAEATADTLVRAACESATALHSVVRDVPLSAVPTVMKVLAWRVSDLLDRLEDAPMLVDWAPGDARRAHARYARGLRDPWTLTGERSYQREKKRRYARERWRPQIAELSVLPAPTCDDGPKSQVVHNNRPRNDGGVGDNVFMKNVQERRAD